MERSVEQFIDGRIVGGYSVHDKHDQSKCRHDQRCSFRTVDCCNFAGIDRDIVECVTCGKQKNVSCDFDDEYC